MSWANLLNTGCVYAEARVRSLRLLNGNETAVLPLERQPNGRLTAECKQRVSAGVQGFLKRKPWQPRGRTLCAVEARGVSLRRLTLPAGANGELEKVLRLRLETEFPVAPEALAWGYARLDSSAREQEVLIAALKKEWLQDYAQIFADAGVNATFTVGAVERVRACGTTAGSCAVLDIGRKQSELVCLKNGQPETLRVLAWGGDDITRAIELGLGITATEAEKLKLQTDQGTAPNGEVGKKLHEAIESALQTLASLLRTSWEGQRLYVTGRASRYREMPRRLAELLPGKVVCERIETGADDEVTAAIIGLRRAQETGSQPLTLGLKESRREEKLQGGSPARWLGVAAAEAREITKQPALWKWGRLGLVLLACLLCFPLAEAVLMRPLLEKKLARIEAEKGRLGMIEREFTFLRFLKKSEPPYLDALTVIANAAPPGTRFDTLSMNRRGDVSFRGNMQNAQQVVDFRSKLIKSGFFSNVTLEEQTPSQDRQRMTVRVAALWKPAGSRPIVKPEPLPAGGFPGGPSMPFPDMGGAPPMTFFPAGEMPPGVSMPPMPGGMPTSNGKKSEKSKGSARVLRISPGGSGESIEVNADGRASKDLKPKKDGNE